MSNLVTAVLLLILAGVSGPPKTSLAAGPVRKARLELTTTVVQQKSCFPGHLSLQLRFTFKNVGEEPVIIDKRSFITRSLVSRSLNAAIGRKYVQEIRADLFADSFPVHPTDMSHFVILRPGETYDLHSEQTRVSLYVAEGNGDSKDHLRPGNYFLQVEIATWSYLGDAQHFRQRWKTNGVLWDKGLTSQPMPFVIEQNQSISKCP